MGFCYKTGSISLGGKFRSSRNVTGLKAYLRMDMAGFKQLIHRLTGPLIRWLQDKRLIFQKLQVKPGIFAAFFFIPLFLKGGHCRVQGQLLHD
mgnify:CR=1 FL=1